MFRRTDPTDCTFNWEGQDLPAKAGESVAAALLAAGMTSFRETPVTGSARGPLCLMGACFDCLVEVEGVQNVQACLTEVTPGLRVSMQHGARSFAGDEA